MFMRVGALCADRERIRRVFVFFCDFPTFRAFLRSFARSMRPFFDLFVAKTAFSCVHFYVFRLFIFSSIFALCLEKYGVRPEKVFKKSDFLH